MKKTIFYFLAIFIIATACEKNEKAEKTDNTDKKSTEAIIDTTKATPDETPVAEVVDTTDIEIKRITSNLKCNAFTPVKGKKEDIIGAWKLVQTWDVISYNSDGSFSNVYTDASCSDIYIDFKNDSVLTIKGNDDVDFKEGVYRYCYTPMSHISGPLAFPGPNFHIEGIDDVKVCLVEEYKCNIGFEKNMHSPMGGFFIKGKFFIRVK